MNKLKYIRIQNKNSSYGERFPIAVDGENVYMEEGINLQTQVKNLYSQIANTMKHTGIYVGDNEPTGKDINIWIDPDAQGDPPIVHTGIYVGDDEPTGEDIHIWIDTDAQGDPPIVNAMPIPVLTAAQMTDPTKIYLYEGQESGYLPGYWYYYNGYIWAFGGIYGTAITDNTLSQMGVPADAKAVRDSINAHATTISGANDILTITIGGN